MKADNIQKTDKNQNFTYLLRCADGTLYCGWTNSLEDRLLAHNQGRGAKYTRSRRPVELVYYEVFATKQEAMQREWAIKHLTRQEKLALCQGKPCRSPCCIRKGVIESGQSCNNFNRRKEIP